MANRWKKLLLMGLSLCMIMTTVVSPALATEYTFEGNAPQYNFEGNAPGETFHQSTSTDQNYVGNNGQIVVGTDGTVSSGVTGNQTSGPLSSITLPVGEYPEAFGFETDVDIAMNSIFPNELGPTTQNSNYYTPVFTPTVESGALPTGRDYMANSYSPVAFALNSLASVQTYSSFSPRAVYTTSSSGVGLTPIAAAGNGAYLGLATSVVSMPTITKGGAIGRISIPSIGLNKYVYEGTSQANMRKGVAHFDSTAGFLGNIGLAGHNRGSSAAFAKLKDVTLGDTVTYTTAYGTLTYMITDITTCLTTDTSGLQQDGTNKLTMYTCVADQPDIKLKVTAALVGGY